MKKHVVFDVDVIGGISLKEYFLEILLSFFVREYRDTTTPKNINGYKTIFFISIIYYFENTNY